jgi:hypothetical protein
LKNPGQATGIHHSAILGWLTMQMSERGEASLSVGRKPDGEDPDWWILAERLRLIADKQTVSLPSSW